MKTKYTSLVSVKKNTMQKSEQALQNATKELQNSENELLDSILLLNTIETPTTGKISDFLSSRTLLDTQRNIINSNQQQIISQQEALQSAKEQLKLDMIEFEKYNYLEVEEIKNILNKRKIQEAKDLDEIALMTYAKKRLNKEAS